MIVVSHLPEEVRERGQAARGKENRVGLLLQSGHLTLKARERERGGNPTIAYSKNK